MTEATLRKQALACILLIIHTGIAGQVGIGTTSPNQSSILDVSSTTKGVLIPRMTMSQRTALSNPSDGLTVYQTDDAKGFYFFNGSMWLKLTNAIPSDQLTTNNYRSIQIFDTPGTYTWEVPTGVTKIIAELWGGGGGTGGNGGNYSLYTLGGWVNGTGGTGAVGGKGGYNKVSLNVLPGQTFSITVGGAGTTGSNGSNGSENTPATNGSIGGSGGNSSFGSTTASGGTGGGGGTAASKCGYNCAANGSTGTVPPDAAVLNYDYPYNSFQQIRSYIPSGYIPIYPTSKSNAGENGLVLIFIGE